MKANEFSSLRMRAGLSIEETAKSVGYSSRHVRRWDNGEKLPREAVLNTLRGMVENPATPFIR